MSIRTPRKLAWAASASVLGIAASVAGILASQGGQALAQPTVINGITVYQGKLINTPIVLGPQSNPTLLTETQPLPAGTYMVTAIVGAVIASHDQIVCAVSNVQGTNDSVFGTAGNAGTGSDYGTATITDTLQVSAGQRLYLGCNSFNFGNGTYAGTAVLEAVPVVAASAAATTTGKKFGNSVAVSGGSAVAGAPYANSQQGAAFVFAKKAGGAWRRQPELTDPARTSYDNFGSGVAVTSTPTGPVALVGAPGTDGGAGAAYLYARSARGWRKLATLHDPGAAPGDRFGTNVAISGDTAVVGAPGAASTAGAAYVYTRSGSGWHLQASLADPGGTPGDSFGTGVSISGTTAMAGAPGAGGSSGAAYIYSRSGTTWRPQAKLPDPRKHIGDYFGGSVAVSGTTAVAGSFASNRVAGAAYVYARSGAHWSRKATLAQPHPHLGDYFGTSLAISGGRILVGAPRTGLRSCGATYEFARSGSSWRERAKVVNPGCSAADAFGHAVALSGRSALIGAPGKNSNAGAVYQITLP